LAEKPAVCQPAALNASGIVTNEESSWSSSRCIPVTLG
jgi:hypothetical protein